MFMQTSNHSPDETQQIEVLLNGQAVQVAQGLSVASVILGQGEKFNRTTPISGAKRAPFCMMGACYDCLMIIDGKVNQRACSVNVKNGMKIETQLGVGAAIGKNVR